jgi:hypothetical protein
MAKSSPRRKDDKIIAQAIAYAVQFQQQGVLDEAENASVLRTIPHHFDALHLMGVLRHQQGNDAEAVKLIDAAVSLNVIGVPREIDARVIGANPVAGPQDWPLER